MLEKITMSLDHKARILYERKPKNTQYFSEMCKLEQSIQMKRDKRATSNILSKIET